jgi:hypothetical protein
MDIISVKNDFGDQIEDIWNNKEFDSIIIKERGFAVQDEIARNSLLFVGINPSYNNKPEKIFYNNEHSEVHPYFKKFIDISNKVKLNWSHIDLLFIRETSQNVVKDMGSEHLGHRFFEEQLKISIAIIEKTQPKIIVVNNTYARDLLKRKFDFEFDEEIGTHRIKSQNSLNNCPVFFTGMLTGQRALDLGSYERLIWQIKYVLKKMN